MCIRDRDDGRAGAGDGGVELAEDGGHFRDLHLRLGGVIAVVQADADELGPVSYTHLRAHETVLDLVCRLLLEKKKENRT